MAMFSWETELRDLAATQALGRKLAEILTPPLVLLLKGDLGAGKTSLIQGLAQGLGISEPVVSPTFALINEYYEGRCPLYHLDLYRLSPAETEALYLEQYWDGADYPPGFVAIEWPERLGQPPPVYLEIELAPLGDGRKISLRWSGAPKEAPDLTALGRV
ncbi:MAG: tRNA (adenosine(37)-N6)-threonylcarbamoyltransferase complex ATPase subunit type 1 TsaE [Cyanobacteria bacterium RI_101]|nr:tRNA (adenosine(37)-N6)-threonylcarbamoyltransferase complex ATPase subunit type 1 TsaE [Cyanobacteria bacterium RI_101]